MEKLSLALYKFLNSTQGDNRPTEVVHQWVKHRGMDASYRRPRLVTAFQKVAKHLLHERVKCEVNPSDLMMSSYAASSSYAHAAAV